MLAIFAKLLKALNSEASPQQIGWAVALGVLAGLVPFGLLTFVILFVVCIFTVNLTTFFVVWGVAGALSLLLGGLIDSVTWQYAQNKPLLTLLGDVEFLQILHLHYTQVLGGLVLGLLLLWPIAWLSAKGVLAYRGRVMTYVQKLKIVQALKASKLAQIYSQLS